MSKDGGKGDLKKKSRAQLDPNGNLSTLGDSGSCDYK